MRIKQRKALYADAIPFPAAKAAGASTILSEKIAPFKDNPGKLRAHLIALDTSKIADELAVNVKVSYDGETWDKVASFNELKKGKGSVSILKDDIVSFAPAVRLETDFNSTGALLEEHGCKVHIDMEEGEFKRFFIEPNSVEIPDTVDTTNLNDAVAATIDVVVPVGINAGDSVVVSDEGTTETYDIYDNVESDYAGGNILVDIQTADPDIPALIASAINTNSSLVGATEVEGTITVTASTAGIAGNDITVTVNPGANEVKYNLAGGADATDIPEATFTGKILDTKDNLIEEILVASTCNIDNAAGIISYVVEHSNDGTTWQEMAGTTKNLTKLFEENRFEVPAPVGEGEEKVYYGPYFRVVVSVADGKTLENHSTKLNLIALYK